MIVAASSLALEIVECVILSSHDLSEITRLT